MEDQLHPPEIVFDVTGARIDLEQLLEAVTALLGILRDVDSESTSRAGGALTWEVTDLAGGSAHIELLPVPKDERVQREAGSLVVKRFAHGIQAIRNGGERPPYFTNQALRYARKLTSLVREDGFEGIAIRAGGESIQMDQTVARNVDDLIEGALVSIGSVEGDLKTVSLAGLNYFNVYDAVTGAPLRCTFPPAMIEQVRAALGRRVVVHGTFTGRPGAEPSTLRVDDLEVVPDEFELPTVDAVRGILKHA